MGDIDCSRVGVRGLIGPLLAVAVLIGCGDTPPPGPKGFGEVCKKDTECNSLICVALEVDAEKLCSVRCDDPLGDECGSNGFRCRRPAREDFLACVCTRPEGCAAGGPGPTEECMLSSDCDDGIACTDDSCFANVCRHIADPSLCGAGESCMPGVGCVVGQECTSDSECSLGPEECAGAFCDLSTGRCVYQPIDADGDGHYAASCGGDDCDDTSTSTFPLAPERCDNVDNDCDGRVDETASLDDCGGAACSFGACMFGCARHLTDCSGLGGGLSCVDTRFDPVNCGGCGFTCGSDATCQDGRCVTGTLRDECALGAVCPPNSTCFDTPRHYECRCNAGYEPDMAMRQCVDVDECARGLADCDPSGTCFNLTGSFSCGCRHGYRMLPGTTQCADVNECAEGYDCGNGYCTNTAGSFTCTCNFGYAFDGVRCVLSNACQAGVQAGHRWCNGACRNILFEESHCGGCNNACAANALCQGGTCACNDVALTHCSSTRACVNLRTDARNCGACGAVCPAGATCSNGMCACPSGQVVCNGRCVALGTESHCRACNDGCPAGAACTASGCACPASAPTSCFGECVNTITDWRNCGLCDNWCDIGSGSECVQSECKCPGSAKDMCGNSCVDFATTEWACGDCTTYCDVICNEGECATALDVALGSGFGCVLFNDGRVGCFGSNARGRLGRGLSTTLTSEPLGLLPLTDIVDLATRDAHACAVDMTGRLWCWGENSVQQVGNGNTTDQISPVMVRTGVAQVATGLQHTCVVLQDGGRVECIGSDALGQRGDGATQAGFGTWTGPSELANVEKLVSGASHVCALAQGKLWCWGDNSSGQLGTGTAGAGQSSSAPVALSFASNVAHVAAGQSHTCAVLATGTVACWGENSSNQLGITDPTDRVAPTMVAGISDAIDIAAGDAHTCALSEQGLLCWGSGSDRQNGRTTTGPERTQLYFGWSRVAAGGRASCGVYQGDFYCWGDGPSITNGFDTESPIRIER